MLEMKEQCERCEATLGAGDEAYICSYECTWCPPCFTELKAICPNCGGDLQKRPKRDVKNR